MCSNMSESVDIIYTAFRYPATPVHAVTVEPVQHRTPTETQSFIVSSPSAHDVVYHSSPRTFSRYLILVFGKLLKIRDLS